MEFSGVEGLSQIQVQILAQGLDMKKRGIVDVGCLHIRTFPESWQSQSSSVQFCAQIYHSNRESTNGFDFGIPTFTGVGSDCSSHGQNCPIC